MAKQPRVGVVLSGCGYLDGAEIHESVLTLYFLAREGAAVRCFAPDRPQMHVVDHRTGEVTTERRNVLAESARIARGAVEPLDQAAMDELDALVLPGGYGVAKNLSNFAVKGSDAEVDGDLQRLIEQALRARKPIVAICISPAILAAALARTLPRRNAGAGDATRLTIGNDPESAQAIGRMGATHVECTVRDIVVDEAQRVISTPAYMLGPGPADVGVGIEAAIRKLMTWL